MKIQAAVADVNHKVSIQTVELDDPKPNEVLIKTIATGICHSDLAGRDGVLVPNPVVLGHEGAGIVEKVGSSVTSVKPGDHVVTSVSYCGHCKNCLSGHPMLCENLGRLNFINGTNYDGTHRIHSLNGKNLSTFFGQSSLATRIVSDEHSVTKVDPKANLKYMGPFACGLQTGAASVLQYLNPRFGSTIVVTGAGGVGLSAIMAAKITNASHIIAIDHNAERLQLAKELGATEIINTDQVNDVEKAVFKIVPGGVDYSLETTGYTPLVKSAVHVLHSAGTAIMIAIAGDVSFNINDDIMAPSKKIIGLTEGDAIPQLFIPKLVQFYEKGLFPFDKMVKFYKFKDVNKAIDDMTSGKTIKPIITFD